MIACIQDWLGSKLGIIIDLSPDNFGKHTKDGTLLAKLLYYYGALPLHIFDSIKPNKNVNDCFNNLKMLKPFLEYLEVPVKDDMLYEMASGQGTAALHLFYALYLNVSAKDGLYLISAQKEKKFCNDRARRDITVVRVPEKEVRGKNVEFESEFAVPLIQKRYMINRHKEKCNEILQKIRSIRENYAKALLKKEPELGPIISRHSTSRKLYKHLSEIESTKNDIRSFDEKRETCERELNYQELVDLQNQVKSIPLKLTPDFEDARGFVNSIKLRTRKGMITDNFHEQMQVLFMDELLNCVRNKQEDDFEELVTKNLLRQSQYEKQMCTKLALVKRQKEIMLENRQKVSSIYLGQIIQKEYDQHANAVIAMEAEHKYDIEFERQRQLELHKRMYVEKVKLKFRQRLEEAKNILEMLISIAIRISEFREVFFCEIPKYLMKDLKELFFKNLSIFDVLEDIADIYSGPICGDGVRTEEKDSEAYACVSEEENDYEDQGSLRTLGKMDEECEETEDQSGDVAAEFIRQEVLNECDLNDYLYLLGPWMVDGLLPNKLEHEVNQSVLGYIVHKMLASKYPVIRVPLPANLKPMNPRAVVQGSNDASLCSMLLELMALRKILVVRIDDAINFVLRAYKTEESAIPEIDLYFQQVTKTALKGKTGSERMKDLSKKRELLKKNRSNHSISQTMEPHGKDVATQTPRNIPEDDPLLSPNAEIGKAAFEALGSGDPVPDIIIVSAVIAYVASHQDEYDGWILWNYPILYSQASKLESALTGYQLSCIDDEMDTVEGLEGFGCRSNCQNPYGDDEFAEKRLSRLVPKPKGITTQTKTESYFTKFLKLRKKNGESMKSNENLQTQGQDWIQKFYMEQNIFYSFEFTSVNFQTVKEIGKIVLNDEYLINEDGLELSSKTSTEIFGEGLTELNEKYNPPKKKLEKEVKKPVEPTKKAKSDIGSILTLVESVKQLKEERVKSETEKSNGEITLKDVRPGDPDWEWATGQQEEDIQLALANFWENLEAIFIGDFKFIFFCLRVHRGSTIKYRALLKRALQNYLRREDDKQNILSEFQQKFNDIDDDLRIDCDIKCELHVRVSELEEVLLEIADDRRQKSDSYRIQFSCDKWITQEMSNLVNLYVRAIQLEADRCIDTCQFINDYYTSLLQKPLQEIVLQKIYAPTLYNGDKNDSELSTHSKTLTWHNVSPSRSTIGKQRRATPSRKGKSEKGPTAGRSRSVSCNLQPEVSAIPNGEDSMNEIFVSLTYSESKATPYHKFFLGVFDNLKNSVKDIVDGCIAEVRKIAGGGGGTGAKDKKKTSDTKIDGSNQVSAEWTAALEAELSRFLFRLKLIQSRGIADFDDFIWTVLNLLASVYEEIGEIYTREVFSIAECCKVFRCAIEEEVAIQPRLELIVDEFIINEDSLLFPNETEESLTPATIPHFRHQFTIEQLSFMFLKLQYIAPNGEIIRRSFLHILEDLRVMKSEDGKPRLLPIIWDELNPNDLPLIFDKVYQRIEVVNWKDFIIYALALPYPTDMEILTMRSNFRSHDPSGTELITLKDFLEVNFWFEGHNTRFENSEVKEFLFKMYQVDEDYTNYTALLLAFCKDEDPLVGFVKSLTLSIGKRVLVDELARVYDLGEGEHGEIGFEEEEEEEEEWTDETISVNSRSSRKCGKCIMPPCQCHDPPDYQSVCEREEEGEAYGICFTDSSDTKSYTSNIPKDLIKRVLMASYPFFPQLSILLCCKETFETTVDKLVKDLSTEDSAAVKVTKLLNHKFIRQLVTTTNKFKIIDMQNIVKSIVVEKPENLMSSSSVNFC